MIKMQKLGGCSFWDLRNVHYPGGGGWGDPRTLGCNRVAHCTPGGSSQDLRNRAMALMGRGVRLSAGSCVMGIWLTLTKGGRRVRDPPRNEHYANPKNCSHQAGTGPGLAQVLGLVQPGKG